MSNHQINPLVPTTLEVIKNIWRPMPNSSCQLYNTVAIPALTYASDVWYVPPLEVSHSSNSCSLVGAMKLLHSIQGQATRFITGGMGGTTFDIFEVHTNTLPVNLLFHKVQINAATCICTLSKNHPLTPITQCASRHLVNRHRTPLHYLFYTTQLKPKLSETIETTHRHPTYRPTLTTKISLSKAIALDIVQKNHRTHKYKVYCDGSSFDGRVGAATILYKNNSITKI